jgi:hypothetical protein
LFVVQEPPTEDEDEEIVPQEESGEEIEHEDGAQGLSGSVQAKAAAATRALRHAALQATAAANRQLHAAEQLLRLRSLSRRSHHLPSYALLICLGMAAMFCQGALIALTSAPPPVTVVGAASVAARQAQHASSSALHDVASWAEPARRAAKGARGFAGEARDAVLDAAFEAMLHGYEVLRDAHQRQRVASGGDALEAAAVVGQKVGQVGKQVGGKVLHVGEHLVGGARRVAERTLEAALQAGNEAVEVGQQVGEKAVKVGRDAATHAVGSLEAGRLIARDSANKAEQQVDAVLHPVVEELVAAA